MGKLLLALGAAFVGLALLDEKLEKDKKEKRMKVYLEPDNKPYSSVPTPSTSNAPTISNDDPDSSSEYLPKSMISASRALAENQNYRALLTPKHVPLPLTEIERRLEQNKQDAINDANKIVYSSLKLKKGARKIRVLRIDSASSLSTKLRCKLDIISMDDKYTALSYTWGDIDDREDISINGHNFSITRELEVTLRHLRTASVERVVWIDAICINQADKAELTWHMSCMREVYAGAEGTFIWLGEGSPQSDYAIEHFNSEKLNSCEALLKNYRSNRTAWLSLEALIDRRWWSRIWIVQEAIVSRLPLIVCGTRFWKFDDFTKLVGFALNEKLDIFSKSSLDSPFTNTVILQQMFRHSFADSVGFHFKYWITVFGLKHICLNPEEKVFGLLGLASDRHRSILAGF